MPSVEEDDGEDVQLRKGLEVKTPAENLTNAIHQTPAPDFFDFSPEPAFDSEADIAEEVVDDIDIGAFRALQDSDSGSLTTGLEPETRLQNFHEPRVGSPKDPSPKPKTRRLPATSGTAGPRLVTSYQPEEGDESLQKPKRPEGRKSIALDVHQLNTDDPEFATKVTTVDFVSQMVLESLERSLNNDLDAEQRHMIDLYMFELEGRFLELSDLNNAVAMQKTFVKRALRIKNNFRDELLELNDRFNDTRVELDRRKKEYAEKKNHWSNMKFINEFLCDMDEINNSLRGVSSSGVAEEESVYDKLSEVENQMQLLGKMKQLNALLEFVDQKLQQLG